VGVSVTTVPAVNDAVQVEGQVMPAGLLLTVPVEVPAKVTVSVYVVAGAEFDCAASPLCGVDNAMSNTATRTRKFRIQHNPPEKSQKTRSILDDTRGLQVGTPRGKPRASHKSCLCSGFQKCT
jgi:hypothetical protein